MCLGAATRMTDYLMDGTKVYDAIVRFGATSTTDDREGVVTTVTPPGSISMADLRAGAGRFLGEIDQVPPAFAAIKVRGRPVYERARAGELVALPPRRVVVHRIDVVSWNPPDAVVTVECSKGTYIRAIARDFGTLLGTGAYLAGLCRRASGRFTLAESLTLDEIRRAATAGYLARLLFPIDEAVSAWPAIVLTEQQVEKVANGAPVESLSLMRSLPEGIGVRAYNSAGRLVALGACRGESGAWYPDKVFLAGEGDELA